MNWDAIFVIAAIAAVYGFGRDILRGMLDRRKKLVESEQQQMMQPMKVHGIVLDDTEKAIAIQSTLMVQSRADLLAEQKRRIEAEARCDTLQQRVDQHEAEKHELLIQLGRAWQAANRETGDHGV